ncbi:hypothetical protein [Microlunatus antarcticus]|uniref:SPFH domain / Band 7 family protein n=1 Tax=Microlunatus antarcticus TaxID=53388 RepID=A0A7W5P645_9ACTN|nr:hypothetical protein [Microlunatus antarcticus]MBB3326063.1 hypothetical protein [Microlunatus antarcticus]
MVAPLVEALLLRAVRRRPAGTRAPEHRPTRLVSRPHPVESVAYVADRTTALVRRPEGELEVLPAGSLVLPALLGLGAPTYVVVTHEPVEVWLRVGPFDTHDDRVVQQVELRLTVALGDSASGLRELADESGSAGSDGLEGLGDAILDRLAREVSARTTEAVRRRTLHELVDSSLGVLLDGALPETFLGGLVERSGLEVVDVDWPTEGRGWVVPAPPATVSR